MKSEWGHSKMALHGIRIAEVRVQFPVSPQNLGGQVAEVRVQFPVSPLH